MTETEAGVPKRRVGGYRLVRSLGRGGFGEVFLGEDEAGGQAAVKLLHAGWASDAEARRRFAAEVEQAQRVSGFCIAEVLDGDLEAEEPWIASEYIAGPTLAEAVGEHGPRRHAELHRLAVATATALAAIHAAGVVHRDFKPENIMLAADGPRVIDFGVARAVEASSVTASGVVGTIGYMAPEQLEGLRLSSAVDIFAWAAVIVYAATGQEAFAAPSQAARIARILQGEPDTGQLDEPLLSIVHACLTKDPAYRPDAPTLMQRLVELPAGAGSAEMTRVNATRVGPASAGSNSAAGGTLAYTRMGTRMGDPDQVPAPSAKGETSEDPPAEAGPVAAAQDSGGDITAGTRIAAAPAPPYWFGDIRVTDPGVLAEVMQQDWPRAARILADDEERAALGAWLVEDAGDTSVDRRLFRSRPTDVNQAVLWLIVQLRPDLPPVFRGRDVSVVGLRRLFANVEALVTGAPEANELALLARPQVLRLLGRFHTSEAEVYARLSVQLPEAEQAGSAFLNELRTGLPRWRNAAASVSVQPALILAFLLHPDQLTAPTEQQDAQQQDTETVRWLEVLWQRVETAQGPERVGCAAAVYAAWPVVRALATEHRQWETALQRASMDVTDAEEAKGRNELRSCLGTTALVVGLLMLPLGLLLLSAGAPAPDSSVRGFGGALLGGGVSLLVVFGALRALGRVSPGMARAHLRQSRTHVAQLQPVVDAGRSELGAARRICGDNSR